MLASPGRPYGAHWLPRARELTRLRRRYWALGCCFGFGLGVVLGAGLAVWGLG